MDSSPKGLRNGTMKSILLVGLNSLYISTGRFLEVCKLKKRLKANCIRSLYKRKDSRMIKICISKLYLEISALYWKHKSVEVRKMITVFS